MCEWHSCKQHTALLHCCTAALLHCWALAVFRFKGPGRLSFQRSTSITIRKPQVPSLDSCQPRLNCLISRNGSRILRRFRSNPTRSSNVKNELCAIPSWLQNSLFFTNFQVYLPIFKTWAWLLCKICIHLVLQKRTSKHHLNVKRVHEWSK